MAVTAVVCHVFFVFDSGRWTVSLAKNACLCCTSTSLVFVFVTPRPATFLFVCVYVFLLFVFLQVFLKEQGQDMLRGAMRGVYHRKAALIQVCGG